MDLQDIKFDSIKCLLAYRVLDQKHVLGQRSHLCFRKLLS
jgi:hypothetical protein